MEDPTRRLVLAFALALAIDLVPRAAPAQHPVPVRVLCFPAAQVLADVEAGRATLRDLEFTDGEGDPWVELRVSGPSGDLRAGDGPAFIGWLSAAQGLFCAVGIKPPRPVEGAPEPRA